jgi:hypothetical protein
MRREPTYLRNSPWTAYKSIDLSRDGEPRAGVNAHECLEDIEKHGFHITDAHVRITESVNLIHRCSTSWKKNVIIERGTRNNPSLANSNGDTTNQG